MQIGDKTEIAKATLAVRFRDVLIVAAGTITGMMSANIPAVLLGHRSTDMLPLGALKIGAAFVYLRLEI